MQSKVLICDEELMSPCPGYYDCQVCAFCRLDSLCYDSNYGIIGMLVLRVFCVKVFTQYLERVQKLHICVENLGLTAALFSSYFLGICVCVLVIFYESLKI